MHIREATGLPLDGVPPMTPPAIAPSNVKTSWNCEVRCPSTTSGWSAAS